MQLELTPRWATHPRTALVSIALVLALLACGAAIGSISQPRQIGVSAAPSVSDARVPGSSTTLPSTAGEPGSKYRSSNLIAAGPGTFPTMFGAPPHPSAISPVGSAMYYPGHYWAGAYYTGTSTTSTMVQVTLKVPDDFPEGGNDEPGNPGGVWYVALLSVFDSNNSYDQLGFVSWYGQWQVVYSTTSGCSIYYSEYPGQQLVRGQTYVFEMTISSGIVHFSVTIANTADTVFSTDVTTGGTDFVLQSFYPACSDVYDFTDYEEVMDTTGPFVPYDFFFTNNEASPYLDGGTEVAAWGVMSSASPPPSGVNVFLNTGGNGGCNGDQQCNVTVANEPYYLAFTNGRDATETELTASTRTVYWNVSASDLSPDSPIYLSTYHTPANWAVGFLTAQGDPPFTAEFSFSFPPSTGAGTYYIGINATDGSGSGSYDRVALAVDVLPILTASVYAIPGSSGIDVGQPATFSANAGGGSGVYSYEWTALPLGCTPVSTPVVRCSPSSAGSFSVAVTITDSLSYTMHATSNYVVNSLPQVGTPSSSSNPALQGAALTVSVTVSGGSGKFWYVWSGLPAGCSTANSTSISCTPTSSGTYSIAVLVTDSDGGSATSPTLSLFVSAAVAGLPATEGYTVIGIGFAALLVVAVLVVAIVIQRRKNRKQDTDSIAKRVSDYPRRVSPSPPGGVVMPPSEAWGNRARGTPPVGVVTAPTSGTEPAEVNGPGYWDSPLVSPPDPTCWNCKFENPAASRYCAKCGLPLEPSPT